MILPKLRGRAIYDAVTQVAEYYLCQQEQVSSLTTYQHLHTQSTGENQWAVQFRETKTSHTFNVDITEGASRPVYATCGSQKIKSTPTYHLKQIFLLD